MDKTNFVEGIAVGAVAGVIATLLLASKSGKETRDEIRAHLEEIKDALVKQLEAAGEMSQAKYDEIVVSLVGEYETAKKITAEEAKEIETRLREGYEAIKETACQACTEQKPAPKPHHAAVK
jgi:gas vesicle protein